MFSTICSNFEKDFEKEEENRAAGVIIVALFNHGSPTDS